MIKVSSLNKTYDRGRRHANKVLHDVSFTLPDTGFVCILGASGCGKTSLLNAIGGLDSFDSGSIASGGVSVSRSGTAQWEAQRNRSFGYIFQNYYLLMDHSAAYNVYMGLHSLGLSHREKLRRVREALRAVGMEHYLRRNVGQLSGGQQQRVAIARALARKPRVIFADEPTGNLDEANTLNICSLLRKISRTSLVVMVTHETEIANFFADRIIRLEEGRIVSDGEVTRRTGLAADGSKSLYAGDFTESLLQSEGINLRLLREEGAESVDLTVVALRDRIVIKLADGRAVSCGTAEQEPLLLEGKRPMLSIETLDRSGEENPLFSAEESPQVKAGSGIGPRMMLREARHLLSGGGTKRITMAVFLLLLTLLSLFTLADYISLSTVDPEDFIKTDPHILEIQIDQGPTLYGDSQSFTAFTPVLKGYIGYLRDSGQNFGFVPHVTPSLHYSLSLFKQLDEVTMNFTTLCYVPLSALGEGDLISGRMPERSDEIVVDRWVLEKAMEKDGIIQNSIGDLSYFLGRQLSYMKKAYSPTIVGISDCGSPAVFMHPAALISIGVNGLPVTPLSELRALYPGKYDSLSLDEGQCAVFVNNAGIGYRDAMGQKFSTSSYVITAIIEEKENLISGSIVVDDGSLEEMLWNMYSDRFYLYCPDKEAALEFLGEKASEFEQKGYAVIKVSDRYSETWDAYEAAAGKKADARTIITFTVMALSVAMLYLLCRSRVSERIGMLAVYRLLGIPGRKIAAIFALESLMGCAFLVLPVSAAVWGFVALSQNIDALAGRWLLPLPAAAAAAAALCLCHVLLSLLPLARLLRLPPARLAAKYDM